MSQNLLLFLGRKAGDMPPDYVTAIVLGQSELEYLFNIIGFYRQIPQPTPGDGNLVVFLQGSLGAAPVRVEVNPASVAAGNVNPAMAALSAALAYVEPTKTFVVGDAAVQGTSREALFDDDESPAERLFSDLDSVVTAIEGEFGPVQKVVECWYNADAALIGNFKGAFWPMYFGVNQNGSTYDLTTGPIDHCLWDATAAPTDKGRGVFARSETSWEILTPMPFHDSATAPAERFNFSAASVRLIEPDRQTVIDLAGETEAQSVRLTVGPSAHVSKFGGAQSSLIHPDVNNPDGQVGMMWPIFIALLRTAGRTISEPTIVDIEGPTDGSYADLVVDLPNGGNLTTLRLQRGGTFSGTTPHRQEVTGVEIGRSGSNRRPVFQTGETSYPQEYRGTVTITDTGSGNPRRGRVRVTPETPFVFGDQLSYLRGQATASLQEPRDVDAELYQDFLIEEIAGLRDNSALYPFPGVAVRPFQEDIAAPVPAPAFTARGATFASGANYSSESVSVPATGEGILSFWFRQSGGSWTANQRLIQFRLGTNAQNELRTTSSGRLTHKLLTEDTYNFNGSQFQAGQWYHFLSAWSAAAGTWRTYVNNVQVFNKTDFTMGARTFTQIGICAQSTGGSAFDGEIGHLYLNWSETLDISQQANRNLFNLNGNPVDVGANGQLPTGNVPEYYYDGVAPAWGNQGTAGSVGLTGTLTPSSAPGY